MSDYSNGVEHAEKCGGTPVITESHGEWSATCWWAGHGVQCGWEVSGCEFRAEAGVAFYGARYTDGRWVLEVDA